MRLPLLQLVCLIMLLSLGLLGCNAAGAVYESRDPAPGKGMVVIYRPPWYAPANSYILRADEEEIAIVWNKGYWRYESDPGPVQFSSKIRFGIGTGLYHIFLGFHDLEPVNVEAGKTHFLRWTPRFSFTGKVGLDPGNDSEVEGLREFESLVAEG